VSREVVGTAEADASSATSALVLDRPVRLPGAVRRPGPDDARRGTAGTRPDPDGAAGPSGSVPGRPPPAVRRRTPRPAMSRRRRAAVVLVLAALSGAAFGWNGAGSWREAQEREVLLQSAGAAAAVVALDASVGGLDAVDEARGVRSAALTVSILNLGGVPLQVSGRSDSLSAVRIRFVNPSGASVGPRARLTVRVVVEVACSSPQALRVPPLQITSPDGLVRDIPLDATAPALGDLCTENINGTAALIEGAAARTGTDVGDLVDDGRFRVSVRAPSGRTTRVVGVRAGGLELTGDPLPATVDGTARVLWLEQPRACDPSVSRSGLPRSLDVDVDGGAGQTATVRVQIGDALARWLLDGPCGEVTP